MKVEVEISGNAEYCKNCRALKERHGFDYGTCLLADIYDGSGRSNISVCYKDSSGCRKCRWCLETSPVKKGHFGDNGVRDPEHPCDA